MYEYIVGPLAILALISNIYIAFLFCSFIRSQRKAKEASKELPVTQLDRDQPSPSTYCGHIRYTYYGTEANIPLASVDISADTITVRVCQIERDCLEPTDGKYGPVAFITTLPRLLPRMKAIASQRAGDLNIAEDAVQEAILRILQKYAVDTEFRINDSYLFNAARRAVDEILRSTHRRVRREISYIRLQPGSIHSSDVEAMVNEEIRIITHRTECA